MRGAASGAPRSGGAGDRRFRLRDYSSVSDEWPGRGCIRSDGTPAPAAG